MPIPGIQNQIFIGELNNLGPPICPVPAANKSIPGFFMVGTIWMVPDFPDRAEEVCLGIFSNRHTVPRNKGQDEERYNAGKKHR